MFYIIGEHRLPCVHVGVEYTPLALCEGSYFASWKVEEELVFSGAFVRHPVFICHLWKGQDVGNTPWVEP